MTSFRFTAAIRKEPMTRRERFALRSPAWCGIHLGAIRHIEPDIAQPIERETPSVAIDGPELLGQTPLDGVHAQRYIGKSAQGAILLGSFG